MAILYSSPFSMQLSYHIFTYSDDEPITDWFIKYHATPLLYGRPFIPPKFLKKWKQPPGVFQFTDCMRECTFVRWLKMAMNGYPKSWHSIEPPETDICLFPGNMAPMDAQFMFKAADLYNLEGIGKPKPDEFLLQWVFEAGYFSINTPKRDWEAPLVIQQWVNRQQLEQFIIELEQELGDGLRVAGVKVK